MKEHVIRVPIEDLNDSPRPRNNRGWSLTFYVALATIILAVPVLLGWVGKAYKISEAPDQIAAVVKHQTEQDEAAAAMKASQAEIRSGLNRILSAMHLEPIKDPNKEKDTQP